VPDRGDEGEQPLADAGGNALDAAGAVAFEVELALRVSPGGRPIRRTGFRASSMWT
jgi:hypothetical protein